MTHPTTPVFAMAFLLLLGGSTPLNAQARTSRPATESPTAQAPSYRSASFPVARAAAATLMRANDDNWATIIAPEEESEDGGGIGWSIRERVVRGADNARLKHRVAELYEGGDCGLTYGVVLRNDVTVLVHTWQGCGVEFFPNTFKLDSLFLEPGQAALAYHFDHTNQGPKPGTDDYRWTLSVTPIPEGTKAARLREVARAMLASDTVALGRVADRLHP